MEIPITLWLQTSSMYGCTWRGVFEWAGLDKHLLPSITLHHYKWLHNLPCYCTPHASRDVVPPVWTAHVRDGMKDACCSHCLCDWNLTSVIRMRGVGEGASGTFDFRLDEVDLECECCSLMKWISLWAAGQGALVGFTQVQMKNRHWFSQVKVQGYPGTGRRTGLPDNEHTTHWEWCMVICSQCVTLNAQKGAQSTFFYT